MNDKVKNIFKNEYFILAVLTLIAFLVRLLNIDKPYGLENDEMLTYIISSKGLPLGILRELIKIDYHMPLHFYYIGIWMKFLGNADISLRLSSVLWGVLSVPAFYFLGKTYSSKNLGYFMSIICALSPILIFYSQEVRFYSMLVFFATLSIIFFLKIIDNPNKIDFLWFGLSNLIILYMYTMGLIFVFFELLILFIDFYLYKKDSLVNFLRYSFIFFIFTIPYFILLQLYSDAYKSILVEHWQPFFQPIPLINDWFSPFLASWTEAFGWIKYQFFFITQSHFLLLVLTISSTICFVIGFINSLIKINKKTLYLFILALSFFLVEIFLWSKGSLHLVTRYTLIFLPIILLMSTNGILLIKNEKLKISIIFIILFIFSYNVFNFKQADSYLQRYDGVKVPCQILNSLKSTGDYIINLREGADYFPKYTQNINVIDFNSFNLTHRDKSKQTELRVFDKSFVSTANKDNSGEKLVPFLISKTPTDTFTNFIDTVINKMPNGKRFILLDGPYDGKLENDIQYKNYFMYQYLNGNIDKKIYEHNLSDLIVIKLREDTKSILDNNKSLKFERKIEKRVAPDSDVFHRALWTLYIYKKV